MRQEHIASVHQVVSAPVVRVASVQIGAQRLTNVEAVVLPLPAELRVDGLLGGRALPAEPALLNGRTPCFAPIATDQTTRPSRGVT